MIRLAGFFAGALLAVASILLVLGVPELPPPEPEHVIIPYEAPAPAVAAPRPEPAADSATHAPEALPTEAPTPEPETLTAEVPPAAPAIAPGAIEAADATRWYSFWSPFRSRIAADGFVRRLESVTGFDYRVVKVETGTYEVAFAYRDDGEREQKLSTIAAATGLELPDS